jgi:hypothetical protein
MPKRARPAGSKLPLRLPHSRKNGKPASRSPRLRPSTAPNDCDQRAAATLSPLPLHDRQQGSTNARTDDAWFRCIPWSPPHSDYGSSDQISAAHESTAPGHDPSRQLVRAGVALPEDDGIPHEARAVFRRSASYGTGCRRPLTTAVWRLRLCRPVGALGTGRMRVGEETRAHRRQVGHGLKLI